MILARVWAGVRWMAAIEHWTAAVALGLAGLLVFQLIGVGLGFTRIAKSPYGTIEALYQAAQDGEYDAARDLLDQEGRRQAAAMDPRAWRELVDGLSEGQTIEAMEFANQRNYGSNVVIGIFIHYTDGGIAPAVEELVREGGEWRIMWEPGTRRFVETVQKYEPWFGR